MPRPLLREYQRMLAPGTALREALQRILQGRTGALIVIGNNPAVRQASSGGFKLDVEFTPQAVRELAKMDGAIIVSNDLSRIVAAGVHLVPAGGLPSAETGTRHRTADVISQSCQVPTITVSASMSTISLFLDGNRHVLEPTGWLLRRAESAVSTLERFVARFHETIRQFNALEIANQVSLRDVVHVAQRYETTRRLSAETEFHIEGLGDEGRLTALQHTELMSGLVEFPKLLTADYRHELADGTAFTLSYLSNFTAVELMSVELVAERMGFGQDPFLGRPLAPRGIRLLQAVGRLPEDLALTLVDNYTLAELFGARTGELAELTGVGPTRARMVRDALARILDGTEGHAD